METKLVAAFRFFDKSRSGAIDRSDLTEICKQLDPERWTDESVNAVLEALDKSGAGYIDYSEFAVWLTSGMMGGERVLSIYEEAAAKMPGDRLADGDLTDAGLDKIRTYLNNVLDLTPEQYTTPKATNKLTWLRDIADLLDPTQNPGGFRICQNALVERGAVGPLLGLAQKAQSDAVVMKSLEILARTAFGNAECAADIAKHEDVLTTLRSVLTSGKQPETLAALQLTQALAACAGDLQVNDVVPKMLAVVVPSLAASFPALVLAAFDVFVSVSFTNPAAVVDALSWKVLTNWLADGDDLDRPTWVGQDNLTVLACGLLAVNVLSVPSGTCEIELEARKRIQENLGKGNFLEFFVLALDAAVAQREWPACSGAFHSVNRLATVASKLARLGFRRQLAGVVAPLAKAAEINPGETTTRLALTALRCLVDDLACLEKFLALDEFRSETLEVLHKAGDEEEATELLSCTCVAENALAVAHAALDEAKSGMRDPPSVHLLAELFNKHSPMDGEISKSQLLELLAEVPIGPKNEVEACLSGNAPVKFSFGTLAQHVYGTPTLLGWWPSLMEDASYEWSEASFQQCSPPALAEVLFYYEKGAKLASGVTSHAILHDVLPAWNMPVEGELLEDLFAEIRGDSAIGFKDFAKWMCRYIQASHQQQAVAMQSSDFDEGADS